MKLNLPKRSKSQKLRKLKEEVKIQHKRKLPKNQIKPKE
jgi:hypothetical protein